MHDVCVVGLGYVGLPTACALAQSGLQTVGVDLRKEVVEAVNRGSSPMGESDLAEAVRVAVGAGNLRATTDTKEAVSGARAVIIAVQTPFEGGKTVLGPLVKACRQVAASISRGTTVIVESTVPPGTCGRELLPVFEGEGFKDGSDFYFAYCPERIAPGNSLEEFVQNDRIIGTGNRASRARALSAMKSAVKGRLLETDILTAETTKVVENAARDVYIAFANDLAKMSMKVGVDVREVIALANTHPRVKLLNPGPGVGGPCLTKDPYLLLEGLGDDPGCGDMLKVARKVNDSMAEEVLRLVGPGEGLHKGARVAVLGTAYKADVDDPRKSPSEPIVKGLIRRGFAVSAFDPNCTEGFGAEMKGSLGEAVRGAECAILLVPHREFRGLRASKLAAGMARRPLIVDAAGVFGARETASSEYRLRRLGDGRKGPAGAHPK